MASQDQILGCIMGGAIGDCIGGPVEGHQPPLNVSTSNTSSISDDTQLTLATCEAFTKPIPPSPEKLAKTFLKWHRGRRFTGLGSSTLKSLRDLSFGAHWAIAGASGEMSAGNGAAMRIAPVAFCVDPLSDAGRTLIRDISSITHKNDEAISASLAVAIAISAPTFDFIPTIIEHLNDSNTRDRLISAATSTETLHSFAKKYGTSGYAAESVPLALFAASRAIDKNFKEALFEVISCGGDTDTIGSITGQIIGSKTGYSQIQNDLKSIYFGKEKVLHIATRFAKKRSTQ